MKKLITSRSHPGMVRLSSIHRSCAIAGGLLISALAATAEVKLTFDSTTQGVVLGNAAQGISVGWSATGGGSVAISGVAGFKENMAKININDTGTNPTLKAEFDAALVSGVGYLRYTVRVEQAGVVGSNPTKFNGTCTANTASTYDKQYGSAGGIFNAPTFPLSQTYTTTITIPIKGVAAGGQTDNNAFLEFNTASGYNEILFGLDSAGAGFTSATFYIDDLIISASAPAPAPPAAAFTFDSGLQGFVKWASDPASGTVTYSTNYGGTALLGDATQFWRASKTIDVFSQAQLDNLKLCATRGGAISYDLIAPVGLLSGKSVTTAIKPLAGSFPFLQFSTTILASTVQALPGGTHEIARVRVPASKFGSGLTSVSAYEFHVGFNSFAAPVYLDNVMFAPYTTDSAKLTFDSDEQNFVPVIAASPSFVSWTSLGATVENPPGYIGGAAATFNAASADPQVAAIHAKLLLAASKGGVLRFKVKNITLVDPVGTAGLNIRTAVPSPFQQQFTFVNQATFTDNGGTETPIGYSLAVEVPLYPQASLRTDGFLLAPAATDYTFEILAGYNAGGATSVTTTFDDFEVIVNGDPKFIYQPALPTGSASFVGRVLSNAQNYGVFSATGLPPGVVIDPVTGLISGTPTSNGTFNVVFSVTNDGVTDMTTSVAWVVSGVVGNVTPVITSFSISGTTAVITWSGTGATPVTVSRSTSLASGSWTSISLNNTAGTYTDNSAPAGKAFYRISAP